MINLVPLLTTMVSRFVKFLSNLLAIWFVVSLTMVVVYKFLPVKVTPLMLIRKAEAHQNDRILRIRQTWVPLEDISPNIINAIMNSEDAHFLEHKGFDLNAIKHAHQSNKRYGYIVAGGSTISQQTAKNVFCTPHRTWFRKAVEAYFTVLIEFIWGKERILEVYLNVVEMGDGVFGVQEGSLFHFGVPASDISSEEASWLAWILPYPVYRLG